MEGKTTAVVDLRRELLHICKDDPNLRLKESAFTRERKLEAGRILYSRSQNTSIFASYSIPFTSWMMLRVSCETDLRRVSKIPSHLGGPSPLLLEKINRP